MTLVAGYAAYRIADVSQSRDVLVWFVAMFAISAVAYAYSARRFRGPPTPAPER